MTGIQKVGREKGEKGGEERGGEGGSVLGEANKQRTHRNKGLTKANLSM